MSDTEELAEPGSLDAAVQAALAACGGLSVPDVLVSPATGAARLATRLQSVDSIPLSEMPGVPLPWFGATLHVGVLGETSVWLVEDAAVSAEAEADWMRAFPVWWAAAAGAKLFVHASAGTDLRGDVHGTGEGSYTIGRLTDHINLSGASPLTGIGASRLGPLFPDQTRLHDVELASVADACAAQQECNLEAIVAACTLGPALSTPAELRWYAAAGAEVAVQRLADPMIAAAHAGLGTLALCALTDRAGENASVGTLVARAADAAPALDELVLKVTERLGPIARARVEEESP